MFTFCCALCLLALTSLRLCPPRSVKKHLTGQRQKFTMSFTMTVVDGSTQGQVNTTILNATEDRQRKQCRFLPVCRNGRNSGIIGKKMFVNTAGSLKSLKKDMPRRWPSSGPATALWIPGHYRAVKWFFEFHENETGTGQAGRGFCAGGGIRH